MKLKKVWFYYLGCILIPHVMLAVGLIFLASRIPDRKILGKQICIISSIMLVAGSFIYYLVFMPPFGLD